MDEVKSGWKTSEFWVSMIMTLAQFLLQANLASETPIVDRVLIGVIAALTALGYVASRTFVKVKAKPK